MSRYRKVDPRIWNDEKFRALSDMGKLVFFMLLTHPSMTALGAMRGTIAGLAEELGWTPEAFRDAFEDALHQGMAEHDPKACLIALPNFVRYNLPESPNVIKAWVGALDLLPECDLKLTIVHRAKGVAESMSKGFADAFREAFAQAMPYQEPEPKQKPKNTVAGATVAVDAFSAFWQAWPSHKRKVARSQCAAKWETKGCDAFADAVMAALARAVRSEDWTKEGGKYIPAPLVWLNQDRWEAPAAEDQPSATPANPQYAEHMARLAEDRARATAATPEHLALMAAARQRVAESRLAAKPARATQPEESDA
jgi:hypothetical protein